jgi:hypothetical protein
MKDARVEGGRLRTRGKSSEVLLWQGLRIKTLGERGSLWCCYSKASCSLLLPWVNLEKRLAQMKHKIKTRRLNEGECCYSKALSSNPKRKTALSVDNLGLGRFLPLEFKMVRLAKERKKECSYG